MTYEIGTKVLIKISEMLSDNHKNMVYSIYANEVAAIIPTSDFNKAYEIGLNLLNKMADSIGYR